MSFWLKNLQNVGHLLEQLDGQAERVVEERTTAAAARLDHEEDDGDFGSGGGKDAVVESILAARGLGADVDNDDDDEHDDEPAGAATESADPNRDDGGDEDGDFDFDDGFGESQEEQDDTWGLRDEDEIFETVGGGSGEQEDDEHVGGGNDKEEEEVSADPVENDGSTDKDRTGEEMETNYNVVAPTADSVEGEQAVSLEGNDDDAGVFGNYKQSPSQEVNQTVATESDHQEVIAQQQQEQELGGGEEQEHTLTTAPAVTKTDVSSTSAVTDVTSPPAAQSAQLTDKPDGDETHVPASFVTPHVSAVEDVKAAATENERDVEVEKKVQNASHVVVPGPVSDHSRSAHTIGDGVGGSDAAAIEQAAQRKQQDEAVAVAVASSTAAAAASAKAAREAQQVAREAQKESRMLRRHVVSLNKQLEVAETEIQAQRKELERAGEQMEKDRTKNKEEREKEKNRAGEEVKNLKAQHDLAMREMKQRSDQQLEEVRKNLRDLEQRRAQEGGDWNKELADAARREQEMADRLGMLEDEKGTLLSQITTLQVQQESLGNRIESLSSTADSAMEREREAETRLDEALTLHAKQIGQRQAREAELEQTIAELGAALVEAKNKVPADRLGSAPSSSDGVLGAGVNGGAADDESSPEARVQTLEHDMETLRGQLANERQQNETLQNELREVAKERTEETSVNQKRQSMHDRQVAELSETIRELKSEVREANSKMLRRDSSSTGGGIFSDDNEDAKQIKGLSEEVLKQREKVLNCNSEISALKSRLQVASDRAAKAEAALEASAAEGNGAGEWSDIERGEAPASMGGTRFRGGRNRRKGSDSYAGMRSALTLDMLQGESGERIGKALDGIDAFLAQSGKFLRYHPLARLLFIMYLILLHLWTFVVLFLHAHAVDPGSGGGIPHGPHSLMQQQSGVLDVLKQEDQGVVAKD